MNTIFLPWNHISLFFFGFDQGFVELDKNAERIICINPFQANVSFLYPLKTSGNVWLSDFCKGYGNET